jgi:hypothetical protein
MDCASILSSMLNRCVENSGDFAREWSATLSWFMHTGSTSLWRRSMLVDQQSCGRLTWPECACHATVRKMKLWHHHTPRSSLHLQSFWQDYTAAAKRFTIGEVLNGDIESMLRYTSGPRPASNSILNFPLFFALTDAFAQKGDLSKCAQAYRS